MDDLYREEILQHYKRPHNWGPMEAPDLEAEDHNPLCGDQLKVMLKVGDDERVAEIRFEGHGCAISQASASMASDEIVGMPVSDLLRLDRSFVLDLLGIDISRDAHEVRAAVAEGHQGRRPRPRGRLGAGDAGGDGALLAGAARPHLNGDSPPLRPT